MNLPTCECFQDGHWQTIKASDLVVGDIIDLKTGMYVPADVYLFDNVSIQIDESVLTGESVAIMKKMAIKPICQQVLHTARQRVLCLRSVWRQRLGKLQLF